MSASSTKGIRPMESVGSDFDPTDPSFASDPMLHLTRVFVYFLQNLFRDFPEGCGMHWRPEQEAGVETCISVCRAFAAINVPLQP